MSDELPTDLEKSSVDSNNGVLISRVLKELKMYVSFDSK